MRQVGDDIGGKDVIEGGIVLAVNSERVKGQFFLDGDYVDDNGPDRRGGIERSEGVERDRRHIGAAWNG